MHYQPIITVPRGYGIDLSLHRPVAAQTSHCINLPAQPLELCSFLEAAVWRVHSEEELPDLRSRARLTALQGGGEQGGGGGEGEGKG